MDKFNNGRKEQHKKLLVIFLIIFVLAIIFSYMYVYNEDNVYVYDYIGYQLRSFDLVEQFQLSISSAFSYLLNTIAHLDYNLFPVFPLVPILTLFGSTRVTYILGTVVLYVVPTMFLLIYILIKQYDIKLKTTSKEEYLLLSVLTIGTFCFTGFWSATLRGLPDIIGVIPIYLLMLLMMRYQFTEKIKFQYSILFGILAYLPFLCRRWYAYAVVALYLSYFIVCLLSFIKSNNKKAVFKNCFVNFMISGVTTLIMLCALQLPLVKGILQENYSETYSAFQYSLSGHINGFIGEFGIIILVLALIGIVYGIIKKRHQNFTIYSVLNIVIFVFLFTRTQGMGVHHYLGISPYIIYLALNGIIYLYNQIHKYRYKILFSIIIMMTFILNFSTTYIFRNKNIPIISQTNTYNKFRYENYNNLVQFVNDISNYIVQDYGKVSCFANSDSISDSLIDVVGNENIHKNLLYTSNVDLRDGLNYNSLLNRYVIITDKAQAFSPSHQQTLVLPNEMIYNNNGIGKGYKKVLGPYTLANNIKVYLYQKQRAFSEKEIDSYLNHFYRLYPDWKTEYYLFDKFMLTSDIVLGDQIGEVKRLQDNLYYLSPGYTDTVIKSQFSDNMEKIKLKFYIDGNIPDDKEYGVVDLKIIQEDKVLYEGSITRKKDLIITLDKEKGENFKFEISYGKDFSYDFLYMKVEGINKSK